MLSIHDRLKPLSPVAVATESALRALFCDGGGSVSASHAHAAQEWLRVLRADERWLACDCRTENGVGPLLSPRQLDEARVVLVRHGKVSHSDSCPFHRLRSLAQLVAAGAAGGSDIAQPDPSRPEVPLLEALRRGEGLEVLHRVWRAAGYDLVKPEAYVIRGRGERAFAAAVDVPAHYRRVDLADDLEVAPGRLLSEVGCHHLQGFSWLGAKLASLNEEGVFVGIIRGVDVEKRCLLGKEHDGVSPQTPVGETLTVHSGGGPYWAVARVRGLDGGGCQIVDATLHPVLSGALLLPVDNAFERTVATLLLDQIRYWVDVRHVRVTLRKPLALPGVPAVPDFELHLPNHRRVIVEAHPYDDTDYFALRERCRSEAQDDAPIVRVIAGVGDDSTLRKRLTAAVLDAAGKPPHEPGRT